MKNYQTVITVNYAVKQYKRTLFYIYANLKLFTLGKLKNTQKLA